MKRLGLTVVFLTALIGAFSQQEKKDIRTLQSLLEKANTPSEKTAALTGIASYYYLADSLDKSIRYTKELLNEAEDAGLQQSIVTAHILLGINYGWKNEEALSNKYLSPYKDINTIPRDTFVYRAMFAWYGNFYRKREDYKQSIRYALQTLALRKPEDTKDIAGNHAFLGDMYFTIKDSLNARKHWQKSLPVMANNAQLVINIGRTFRITGKDSDSLLFYAGKALGIIRHTPNKKAEADCNHSIGFYYYLRNEFQKAEHYLKLAADQFRAVNDLYMAGVALNQLGDSYEKRTDYPTAYRYLNESLKIAEQLQHKELLLVNYNDLAACLKSNHDYEKALSYFYKSLKTMGDQDSLGARAAIEGNIATIYLLLNDTVNAQKHFANAIRTPEGNRYIYSKASTINNLSSIYSAQHAYRQSLELIHQAQIIATQTQDSAAIALSYTRLGKLYLEMSKDPDKTNWPDSLRKIPLDVLRQRAAAYLTRAATWYKRTQINEPLHETFRLLSEAQDSTGDYKTALINYRNYVATRDSTINLEKVKQLAELKSQYEIEKNESLARARLQSWIIIGLVSLVSLTVIFFLYRRKENSRFRLELSALKQEALNAQMSDHFIGNTMDSINAFITQNDQQQASKYLILFSRLIRKVLENSTQKLIPLSEDIEVLTAYLELEKLRFNNNFDYSINMADTIDAGNTLVPPMVLQVLAENSIQHGLTKREGGHIAIHIQQQESLILCRVTDNGIGRSITTLATDKSRRSIGSGLAKRLLQATSRSKKAVSYQVTDLLDQNNQPAGTTVAYTLPYIPVE
jgi:hypothetical protein